MNAANEVSAGVVSRRAVLRTFGAAALGVSVVGLSASNASAATPGYQYGWYYCHNCCSLWHGTSSNSNHCFFAAGHSYGSADYVVYTTSERGFYGQPDWRWCEKCGILHYQTSGSHCWAGGEHVNSPSYNYILPYVGDNPLPTPYQTGWRYCSRCKGLIWPHGENLDDSCPSYHDVAHAHVPAGHSYILQHS